MNKVDANSITANQLTYMIVGSMVGLGVLTMPSDVVQISEQDGWLSVAFGVVYPLYITMLAILTYKKAPKSDLLALSKICFGSILGNIFNLIFLFQFYFFLISRCGGLIDVLRIYIVSFLTPLKIVCVLAFLGAYTASKGLKILGRVNEAVFYLMTLLILAPLAVLKEGSILNLMPFGGSGIYKIISGSYPGVYSYYGIEMIFILYPFLTEKEKMAKASIKGTLITGIIYVWFTFSIIYYIGCDIIPKYSWSFLTVTEALTLPIINNFRYIFMFLWSIIVFKTISNYYYSTTYILKDYIKVLKRERLCIAIYPIVVAGGYYLADETFRRYLVKLLVSKFSIFNVIYFTLICIIIYVKKGGTYGKA